MGSATRIVPILLVLLVLLAFFEGSAYGVGKFLQRRGIVYQPPEIASYSQYLMERHPTLGWPFRSFTARNLDPSGSRRIPSFPEPGSACVSLYGDSFTWGSYLSDASAWSNTLSQKLGCRVSNYGIPGYGTDQMLMRFEENVRDEAKITILNHFSGDIYRNVNQFRNLIGETDQSAPYLKPRFVLEGEQLRRVPLPVIGYESFQDFLQSPDKYLEEEYFVPNGESGLRYLQFPFTWTVARAAMHERIWSRFSRVPPWEPFYKPNHPSGALNLTAAIAQRFVELARERGKEGVVTIIGSVEDLQHFQENGRWTYGPLLEELQKRQIRHIDIGAELLARLGDRNPCSLTTGGCSGHYNAEGFRLVGEIVGDYLTKEALLEARVTK